VRRRRKAAGRKRRWIRTVTTVSTAPPPGLFTKDARTIARTLGSTRVSPKGTTSGLRMLLFFINRAGRGLSARRRAELLRAKRLMQARLASARERSRAS
jgi:tRNA(adenine34) deaminase